MRLVVALLKLQVTSQHIFTDCANITTYMLILNLVRM